VAPEHPVLHPAPVAVLVAVQVHQHAVHHDLALVVERLAQVLGPVGVLVCVERPERDRLVGDGHGAPSTASATRSAATPSSNVGRSVRSSAASARTSAGNGPVAVPAAGTSSRSPSSPARAPDSSTGNCPVCPAASASSAPCEPCTA